METDRMAIDEEIKANEYLNKQAELTSFFNKKTVIGFFLAIMVSMIHNNVFWRYVDSNSPIMKIGLFIVKDFTAVAVPLFFIISAVLFYRNYSLDKTKEKYKSRYKTLLIPYFIWNALYTLLFFVASKFSVARELLNIESFNWKNILFGLLLYDNNKAIWFLFDLLFFSYLCPIIYLLLRNRKVGLVVIISTIVLYCVGIKLPTHIVLFGKECGLFWRSDSIIFYLIGAYIGIHNFDWFLTRKSKKISLFCFIGYLLCLVLFVIKYFINSNLLEIYVLIVTIAICFMFWFMFDLFTFYRKPNKIFTTSFMMYVLNIYLNLAINRILFAILPKISYFSFVNYFLSLAISTCIIVILSMLMMKFTPKTYSIITGGRMR